MAAQNTADGNPLMAVRGDMSHLETAFTGISAALDTMPRDRWPLFLGKLSLLLADQVSDADAIANSIEAALKDLEC
jgi:hypothetical protein